MILIYDHRDIQHWEIGIDWEVLDSDETEPEEQMFIDYMTDDILPEAINHPPLPTFQVKDGPKTYYKATGRKMPLVKASTRPAITTTIKKVVA